MQLRKVSLSLGVLMLSLLLPIDAMAAANCTPFDRSLKLGMNGEDVRALQVLLNSDERTKIADSGAGSPSNESTYFGAKTRLAVIKFQELYMSEVLTPAGLSQGSGFVGALSRGKLLALCTAKLTSVESPKANTPVATTSEHKSAPTTPPTELGAMIATPASTATATPTTASSTKITPPYLMFPASYAVHQGAALTISGGGFTSTNNTIIVGETKYSGISPVKGTISVVIPTTAQKGKFTLSFSNASG